MLVPLSSLRSLAAGCAVALLLLVPLRASADEVEVFAAASLTDALNAIAADYEKASGDKIIFNFAASSTLALQIKAAGGAPADLFFSADEARMDDLQKAELIAEKTRRDLLSNTLVVIVPPGSAVTLAAPEDLAHAKIKTLALGQTESVPAGIYARAWLQKEGLWNQLAAHVVPMESVRAALAAVETGNADAGIVYKTDALHSKKVKVVYEVPAADGPAITYPAALVAAAPHAAAAQKLLDYLATPAALAVFTKYGFITKE